MKKLKRLYILLVFVVSLVPNIVFAYSNKVILGGDNIGIKVNTRYVMIAGFYKVDDRFIGSDAGLEIGDSITKVNDKEISNIDEMIDIINNNLPTVKLTVIRNNDVFNYDLTLVKDKNGIYKSGLYVKDTINGIGSLTYVDPESMIFGALGHDIVSKYDNKTVDITSGKIFKSDVISINKGTKGKAGSKEAKFYSDIVFGNVRSNTITGIFGSFKDDISNKNLIEIANSNEIELGNAEIRTVTDDNNIKNYSIEIISIDEYSDTKNILFKVTDKELLNKTGGIIAGMSGSPIIQNNKLVGAVTHVVVDDPSKGFGIFITTMLEEGDKE